MFTYAFVSTAFIDDIVVTRPDHCNAPTISFSIPVPIPIPRGTPTSPTVRLFTEYTRIDPSRAVGVTDSEREVFVEQYDAGILTQSTRMEMSMEDLPYDLISWDMYVLRVKLEVLGVVSNQWSPYSRPLCIRCEECKLSCVHILIILPIRACKVEPDQELGALVAVCDSRRSQVLW